MFILKWWCMDCSCLSWKGCTSMGCEDSSMHCYITTWWNDLCLFILIQWRDCYCWSETFQPWWFHRSLVAINVSNSIENYNINSLKWIQSRLLLPVSNRWKAKEDISSFQRMMKDKAPWISNVFMSFRFLFVFSNISCKTNKWRQALDKRWIHRAGWRSTIAQHWHRRRRKDLEHMWRLQQQLVWVLLCNPLECVFAVTNDL